VGFFFAMYSTYTPINERRAPSLAKVVLSCLGGFLLGLVMVLTYSSEVNLYTQNTPIVKAEVVVPAHTISVERAKQSIAAPVQAAISLATTTVAAPAFASAQVAAVAEANIVTTAIVCSVAVLVGLVIGFALLFAEDQISK